MKLGFKLAVRNIIRSPGKFILQGAILYVLMLAVFVVISIQAGTARVIDDVHKRLGSEVRLIRGDETSGGQSGRIANPPYVTEALGGSLLPSQYITAISYCLRSTALSDIRPAAMQSQSIRISPKPESTALNTYSFVLMGESRPELDLRFSGGSLKITAGSFRSDNAAESGGDAVISRLLAEENGFGVGSVFSVFTPDSKIKRELRVAGIFDSGEQDDLGLSYASALNSIFVAPELARKFAGDAGPGFPPDVLTYVSYFLDSPEQLDEFAAEAASKGLDMEKFRLEANDGEYMRRTAQLRGLEAILRILLAAVLGIGAVFTVLCAFSAVKKRGAEIGLLRTMGVVRKDIFPQFIVETLIVGFIALAAAGVTGASGASSASGAFLREQIGIRDSIESTSTSIYMIESGTASAIVKSDAKAAGNAKKTEDIMDGIETSAGPGQVVLFLLAGFFVLVCGASAAGFKVLRHNPMDALKGESDSG